MQPRQTLRIFLLANLFLVCCRPLAGQVPGNSPAVSETVPATQPAAMGAQALVPAETTATATATWMPVPTLTAIPTSEPTATVLPAVKLSVPEVWRERSEEALKQAAQGEGGSLVELEQGAGADITLVNEEGAFEVQREAAALVVPFTSARQAIGLEEAMTVVKEGHEQIAVMPWSEMPLGMKALRVDGRLPADADYPLQEVWSLQAAPGYEETAAALLPFMQAASADPLVHLVAVGDIMLDRSLGTAVAGGNLEYPFAKVSEHLRTGDLTIGNVESALGDTGTAESKRYPFRAPPEAAESLALAGFDIVSLANNHGMDYGEEALLQAISLLQEQGIAAIGAGANAAEAHTAEIREVDGLKLAFFGYVNVPVEAITGFDTASWTAGGELPGVAWADPEVITADVTAVQDEVDLTVVVLHSGFEYVAAPSAPQIAAAHAAIDAGADLVIGHHAHILQGIEFYGDGAIIYGTGNFAFEIDGPPETAIFDIWLDSSGVRQIEISPAIVQFGGQPRLVEAWEDIDILSRIYYLSDILNTN